MSQNTVGPSWAKIPTEMKSHLGFEWRPFQVSLHAVDRWMGKLGH